MRQGDTTRPVLDELPAAFSGIANDPVRECMLVLDIWIH